MTALAINATVRAAAPLAPWTSACPVHDSHVYARKPGAFGTVRSTETRGDVVVFFVQHEEHGSFAAYLEHEIEPATPAAPPPRLEVSHDQRNPFINLSFPGHTHGMLERSDGRLPCLLCAAIAFPDGLSRSMDVPGATWTQELCVADHELVRDLVASVHRLGPATPAILRPFYPAVPEDHLCLAMEYLGDRGVLQSELRLEPLPPAGKRTAFRMGRSWDLPDGARQAPRWAGWRCQSAWTWGATWLRIRCDACDLTLQRSRGCNVAGFQYATLKAWGAWARHYLLGELPKPRRSR